MLGWLGDLGRLSWGLLYWNVRKTLFQIRGSTGAAPCQHPSDSGLAGKTACEACAGWRNAGRFRRMCPLLAETAEGRRVCSAAAADVRPFWGRALLLYGGALATLALVSLISVFSVFRFIGYQVPFHVVAWPPAWHRIHLARADYFYRMALRTVATGDVRQSYLALNRAYALDPENVDTARLLAQFTQLANPDYSDAIYSRLVLERRGDFERIARDWLRALLSRGDFSAVGALSARMLRERTKDAPAWTEGLLFAERMGGGEGDLDRALAPPDEISPEARSVLSLSRSLRSGGAEERARAVKLYLGGATTKLEIYYALRQLIDLGSGADVAAFLAGQGSAALDPYDRETLKLGAYSALGWHEMERKEIDALMEQGASVPVITLVAGHLVRHPDPGNAAHVFDTLGASPLPATTEYAGTHAALLCMAGSNGLSASMDQEAEAVGRIVGRSFPDWARVREFFESPAAAKNPAQILPALPELPLELLYALNARYRAAPSAGERSGKPADPADGGHG